MIRLPGYCVDKVLYESRQSLICRGRRLLDDLPVVFKMQNLQQPSPLQRARFQQEFDLMRKMPPGESILKAYSIESCQGRNVMILEDFGGTSLDHLNLAYPIPLAELLKLAIDVTECLAHLHRCGIMHKDVNPSHIVWNQQTGQVKLIDLGIATELSREVTAVLNPASLEGTFSYLSPEQTGRMNRVVDYRTDFYSLGVTLYELLAGALPFHSTDPLELVHAHIARVPAPAHQINRDIPEVLSAIVSKLMEKTAEARYQSAVGLKFDLERCLQSMDANEKIASFVLGEHDFSDRLSVPQKLYGRDEQITALLTAFDRARRGRAELLLIAGDAGIGKSALVHEIQGAVARRRGYFIEGKFDQFKKDIPYAAFTQAIDELIRQILTEDESVVARWKLKLLKALGRNAQVIIDVIPNLEWLIGPQPALIDLPLDQAFHRFNLEFRKFIGVLASDDRPLVIFLDDLQWADWSSLQLMSMVLSKPATPHLLFIGAYRDNEVTAAHPMSLILKGAEAGGATIRRVTLEPLAHDEVTTLLSETLRTSREIVGSLALLCTAKTKGNPFFLIQFLGELVAQEMLFCDTDQGRWQWDIARIDQAGMTGNIVDLMLAKLQKLPLPTRQVLQGAACLGNVFDLKMLAVVCELPEAEVARLLWDALQDELIVPLDSHYKYARQVSSAGEETLLPTYRFLNDRGQQAATMLGSEAKKSNMHLVIGRLLLKSLSPEEQQLRLFDLVDHLNLGRALMPGFDEQRNLAQLNLAAAQRARSSAAYQSALVYLQCALELMEGGDWNRDFDLMFSLHHEAAEMARLCTEFDLMEGYLATALQHTTDLIEQAKLLEVRIQALINQGKNHDAVKSGLDVMLMLGVSISKNPTQAQIATSAIRTKMALVGKSIDQLARLPDATNPRILAARNILSIILSPAYYAIPNYFPLLLMEAIRLSLKYGLTHPSSAADFAGYGMILGGMLGEMTKGAQYGKLALRLQERPGMEICKSQTQYVVHALIDPWEMSLHKTLGPLTQDYFCGLEVGDVEYAALSAHSVCFNAFLCGKEVSALENDVAVYIPVIEQQLFPPASNGLKVLRQVLLNLMGQSENPAILQGTAFDADQLPESELRQSGHPLNFEIACSRLILSYLFNDYRAALGYAIEAEKYVASIVGFPILPLCYFYGSLARLALLDSATPGERRSMVQKIKSNQKQLRHWAKFAPANYLHKWALVEAEMASYANLPMTAIDYYEQAIRLAREHDFVQEEALAHEMAAEFYFEKSQEFIANAYLKEALRCYRQWGASAKIQTLTRCYPHLRLVSEPLAAVAPLEKMIPLNGTGSSSSAEALDFATVMNASQALSQEIVLDRLLRRLMQLVIESAGAQRGLLLLEKDHHWFIEAEQLDERAEAIVLQSARLDESSQANAPLPLSLVQYVNNTGESIVIHDAQKEKLVANDGYVQRHQSRSMLIVPILYQDELTGMVYLENNTISGAFTRNRLEVLRLLASQAAISIENARLYADMEERVATRTAELKLVSLRDGLTGVANRRAFDARLVEELARSRRIGQPVSLLIIDIDHFKRINDLYGHPAGDVCLKLLGATLTAECRRAADFVARYGGEEFALVLPDIDMEHAMLFAEKIRRAIQKIVFEIGDDRHPVTVSIGVAEAKARTEFPLGASSLIAQADRCLYAAKAAGRNCVANAT